MCEPSSPQEPRPDAFTELYSVLANEYCRHVIDHFEESTRSKSDLERLIADSVSRGEDDTDPTERAIALHHVALPKLADAGILDYNNHSVRYRGHPAIGHLGGFATTQRRR